MEHQEHWEVNNNMATWADAGEVGQEKNSKCKNTVASAQMCKQQEHHGTKVAAATQNHPLRYGGLCQRTGV